MRDENFFELISEKKESGELTLKVVEKFDEKDIQDILQLEKECFPEDWQYPDARTYYEEMIKDKNNINIFLCEGDKSVGYILAKKHNKAVEELSKYDTELKEDKDKLYIETIQILPEFQGKGGAKKLLVAVCEEATKRGIGKFSIHARTKNNFNAKIKKIFGRTIMYVRKIVKWKPGGDEPYEYIEWTYKN